MNVSIKLTGRLRDYAGDGQSNETVPIDVADGATVADVIALLGIPAEDVAVCSVNGRAVPATMRSSQPLCAGDQLTLMPPIQGG